MTAATLLIDDYEAFGTGAKLIASANDLELDVSTSFVDGLALFLVGAHDLVVCDYNLGGEVPGSVDDDDPAELGLELLARAKVLNPGSRLVLISGALTDDFLELAGKSSFIDETWPKDQHLDERLLAAMQDAHDRSTTVTDWPAVADAHLNAKVDKAEVGRIDQALRATL